MSIETIIHDADVQLTKTAGGSGQIYLGQQFEGKRVRVVAEILDEDVERNGQPTVDAIIDAINRAPVSDLQRIDDAVTERITQ